MSTRKNFQVISVFGIVLLSTLFAAEPEVMGTLARPIGKPRVNPLRFLDEGTESAEVATSVARPV